LRYVLETCETVEQATRALSRIPPHMAYNVTVLDRERKWATVLMSPDRPAEVTHSPVATNHQGKVEWVRHARETATIERERYLLTRLALHEESDARFIGAFLRPPLYSLAFERGFGTLYTAALWPERGTVSYRWPGSEWSMALKDFQSKSLKIDYSV